jgi:fucose permease
MYNLSNITNATNYMEIIEGVNQVSGGYYATFFLVALFLITFISLRRYDAKDVFLVSSFITCIVAILFKFANLVGWPVLSICIIAVVGSLIAKRFWPDD